MALHNRKNVALNHQRLRSKNEFTMIYRPNLGSGVENINNIAIWPLSLLTIWQPHGIQEYQYNKTWIWWYLGNLRIWNHQKTKYDHYKRCSVCSIYIYIVGTFWSSNMATERHPWFSWIFHHIPAQTSGTTSYQGCSHHTTWHSVANPNLQVPGGETRTFRAGTRCWP